MLNFCFLKGSHITFIGDTFITDVLVKIEALSMFQRQKNKSQGTLRPFMEKSYDKREEFKLVGRELRPTVQIDTRIIFNLWLQFQNDKIKVQPATFVENNNLQIGFLNLGLQELSLIHISE